MKRFYKLLLQIPGVQSLGNRLFRHVIGTEYDYVTALIQKKITTWIIAALAVASLFIFFHLAFLFFLIGLALYCNTLFETSYHGFFIATLCCLIAAGGMSLVKKGYRK